MKRDGLRVIAAVGLVGAIGYAVMAYLRDPTMGRAQADANARWLAEQPRLDELVGGEGARMIESIARDNRAGKPACPWPDGRPRHIGAIEYTLRCG